VDADAVELRVLGCLLEKQRTTPDQYPLSLNALTNACNQKSNRDPVMALDDATVQQTIDSLNHKHFILEKSGFGSRVPKFQHRFCNTEFGTLQFSAVEVAILCELMLRGPQTPGELRTRASRMCTVTGGEEIESALEQLSRREDGPFVVKLAREPGRRDSRYAHLLSGEVHVLPAAEDRSPPAPARAADDDRLTRLEQSVAALRAEIEELKRR
jgi:uncharacterized protein YceH (UPF0502 family)